MFELIGIRIKESENVDDRIEEIAEQYNVNNEDNYTSINITHT